VKKGSYQERAGWKGSDRVGAGAHENLKKPVKPNAAFPKNAGKEGVTGPPRPGLPNKRKERRSPKPLTRSENGAKGRRIQPSEKALRRMRSTPVLVGEARWAKDGGRVVVERGSLLKMGTDKRL